MAAPFTLDDARDALGDKVSICYEDNCASVLAILARLRYQYADAMLAARKN